MRAEIEAYGALKHKNIGRMRGIYQSPERFYLVQEFFGSSGTLFDYFIENGVKSEFETRALIQQVLEVVQYCHSQGFILRNLSPSSIMFEKTRDQKGQEHIEIKLSDFGKSVMKNKKTHAKETPVASFSVYSAPDSFGNDSPKCDIWSIGVISYQLMCG